MSLAKMEKLETSYRTADGYCRGCNQLPDDFIETDHVGHMEWCWLLPVLAADKAEIERLRPAMRFVELLEPDEADRAEILSDPEFWAADYAHAMKTLENVESLHEQARSEKERADSLETRLAELQKLATSADYLKAELAAREENQKLREALTWLTELVDHEHFAADPRLKTARALIAPQSYVVDLGAALDARSKP